MKYSEAVAVTELIESMHSLPFSGETLERIKSKFIGTVCPAPEPPAGEPIACPACQARGISGRECSRWLPPHWLDDGGPISWSRAPTYNHVSCMPAAEYAALRELLRRVDMAEYGLAGREQPPLVQSVFNQVYAMRKSGVI